MHFYVGNPEDASPSKPQNLQVSAYLVGINPKRYSPKLTWTANQEPDLRSGPYNIYRKIVHIGGPILQDWILEASNISGTSYIDYDIGLGPLPNQYIVYYKITANDTQGKESIYSDEVSILARDLLWKVSENPSDKPTEFALRQNYPNPFNPTTTIKYDLPADGYVTLKVYDLLGRQVMILVEGDISAGYHEVSLDASTLSSGLYFYRLVVSKSNPLVASGANPIEAGTFVNVKKLLLLK